MIRALSVVLLALVVVTVELIMVAQLNHFRALLPLVLMVMVVQLTFLYTSTL